LPIPSQLSNPTTCIYSRHFVDILASHGILPASISRAHDNSSLCHPLRLTECSISHIKPFVVHSIDAHLVEYVSHLDLGLQPIDGTPMFCPPGSSFLLAGGVCHGATRSGVLDMYKRFTSINSILSFSRPVCGLSGHGTFGHFLYQCLLRLIVAKELLPSSSFHGIFDASTRTSYLRLAAALQLLPDNFSLLPPNVIARSQSSYLYIPAHFESITHIHCDLLERCDHVPLTTHSLDTCGESLSMSSDSAIPLQATVCRNAISQLHGMIRANATSALGHPTKIFLLRKQSLSRRCLNISQLVELAQRYSYQPLYIEDLSPSQQITILANCRYLVAELGSSSCNSFLMPDLLSGLEISGPDVLGWWSMAIPAAVTGWTYYRLVGKSVLPRESATSISPASFARLRDADYIISPKQFADHLQILESSAS